MTFIKILLWVFALALLALGVLMLAKLSRNTSKWDKFIDFVGALFLLGSGFLLLASLVAP